MDTATKMLRKAADCHRVWHRFSKWLAKSFGEDLFGEEKVHTIRDANDKETQLRYRPFNDLELSRRLVGYDVMYKIERYIRRYCPEIKSLRVDDSVYASSMLLLIPHPRHGITVIFIPQCTSKQNQFFLYSDHQRELTRALLELRATTT